MDGANMNAQLGLTSPAAIGADVCHLNLHKTFCIPHGGGGPGVGPIGVAAHLAPFLPTIRCGRCRAASGVGPVAAAPFGSALILPISYAYIRMMGAAGLTRATEVAILNANYVAARLRAALSGAVHRPGRLVAHECIIDCRGFSRERRHDRRGHRQAAAGFRLPCADHVAGRSPGTLMIEPTESEPQGRARPVLRGDDRDRGGDRGDGAGDWTGTTTR